MVQGVGADSVGSPAVCAKESHDGSCVGKVGLGSDTPAARRHASSTAAIDADRRCFFGERGRRQECTFRSDQSGREHNEISEESHVRYANAQEFIVEDRAGTFQGSRSKQRAIQGRSTGERANRQTACIYPRRQEMASREYSLFDLRWPSQNGHSFLHVKEPSSTHVGRRIGFSQRKLCIIKRSYKIYCTVSGRFFTNTGTLN